jgi:prevent-host-death family protein
MHSRQAEPVEIRQLRADLSNLVDRASQGGATVICRRSTPLAALISAADYECFQELLRRDEGLKAVLRGNGVRVSPWTTPKILEVLTRMAAAQ